MNILEKIVADKRKELAEINMNERSKELEKSIFFNRETYSLQRKINDNFLSGIIGEFKRKSPSKGTINDKSTVEEVTVAYVNAQVSGLSILTNEKYFGGNPEDLIIARNLNKIPILRKEFIVSEFQIIESKSIGADAILLIAAILTKEEIFNFSKLAKSLKMEILLEIHEESELDFLNQYIDLVGVNNRNLKTFITDIELSKKLAHQISNDLTKVTESGLNEAKQIKELAEFGYNGFLIGENFMKSSNPGEACNKFIREIYR